MKTAKEIIQTKIGNKVLFSFDGSIIVMNGDRLNANEFVDMMEEYKDQAVKQAVKVALQVASEEVYAFDDGHDLDGIAIHTIDKQSILSCEEEILKQLNIK